MSVKQPNSLSSSLTCIYSPLVVLSGNDISSVGFQDVLLLYKDIIIFTGAHTKRSYSRRLNFHRNIYEGDR